MQTLTVPVWLLMVLGTLAALGFTAVCWVAAGWAERAADWWHDGPFDPERLKTNPPWWRKPWLSRRDLAGKDALGWETPCPAREDGIHCVHWYDGEACCACGDNDPESLELPPERTWEQMTSHQLPVDYRQACPRCVLTDDGFACQADLGGQCPVLAPKQERKVPGWQAEILGAYAALGLEGTGFTRAMARQIKEMAQ